MTLVEFSKRHYHLNDSMIEWCEINIGKNQPGNWVYANPGNWHERNWAISSTFGNTTFYFKNEKDATMFMLKWG